MLGYANKVFDLITKVKMLTDHRLRRSISAVTLTMTALMTFILQYESFHVFLQSKGSNMKKRLRNFLNDRIPSRDAVEDYVRTLDPAELTGILTSMIRRLKYNKVLQRNAIDGLRVCALDGVELFSSSVKHCPDCLTRTHANGVTDYFHRSVVCMSVGGTVHIALGQMMLKPRDGSQKAEGELTGGTRLLHCLREKLGHFADVVTCDALYLTAPFFSMVKSLGMEAVVRLKDENRCLYKDTKPIFDQGLYRGKDFSWREYTVRVQDYPHADMTNYDEEVRVVKFEQISRSGKKIKEVWLVTTSMTIRPETLWKIMRARWEIENNGFHQLKTYYHANHCYCHAAVEQIFLLQLIAFNLRENYLHSLRGRDFAKSNMTLKTVTDEFRCQLLLEKMCVYLE